MYILKEHHVDGIIFHHEIFLTGGNIFRHDQEKYLLPAIKTIYEETDYIEVRELYDNQTTTLERNKLILPIAVLAFTKDGDMNFFNLHRLKHHSEWLK